MSTQLTTGLILKDSSGNTIDDTSAIDFGNVFSGTDKVLSFTLTNTGTTALTNVRVYAYDSTSSQTALRVILGGNLSEENVWPSMVLASGDNITFTELKGNNSYLTLVPTGTNIGANGSGTDTVNLYLKISVPSGAVVDDQNFYLDIEYDNA